MSSLILTAGIASLFAMATALILYAVARQDPGQSLEERLVYVGAPVPEPPDAASDRRTLEQRELAVPFTQRVLVPAIRWLLVVIGRSVPRNNTERIAARLAAAGMAPSLTAETFLGLKIAAAIGLAGLALGMQVFLPPLIPPPDAIMTPLWTGVAGVAGFYLPDLWLHDRAGKRQRAIRRVLPDTIDILSISVEAGLGFDAAVQRICQKTSNPLTAEFDHYLTEIRLGKSRREALHQIQSRTGIDDLNTFIGAVIQADQLGVSIAKILRTQSEQLRLKRRQRAEQLAQKAPLKMLFPMVLFIFPSVFVVILGPAARQLTHLTG